MMVSHDERFRQFEAGKNLQRSLVQDSQKILHERTPILGEDSEGRLSAKTLHLYRSFMQSYVDRINKETFNVAIGGVRIGSAKQTRLAQINLKSRIITFSRFAVENVPERGRRYLVLHELAHVLEASHNKHFWNLVSVFEPRHKDVGHQLDLAFKQNVLRHERSIRDLKARNKDLNPPALHDAIWTPDHGYLESDIIRRLGDPKEIFARESGSIDLDEVFGEYLALQNSGLQNDNLNDQDLMTSQCTQDDTEQDRSFKEDSIEGIEDYLDEDCEGFGVMVGGS